MKERVPCISEWESGELSMAALYRKYGVSRQTGHKWTRRYKEGEQDIDPLRDRSRAALCHPWTTQEDVVDLLIRVRKQRPTWGCEHDRFDPEAVRDDEGAPSSTTHADEPGGLGATRSASECRLVHGHQRSVFDGRWDRRVSA
ncbi:MAG: hypothetical protein H6832_07300 [Planctomycetes bacterium]|nr:hypothetical protein [Planctomycetota bacterium]